MDYIPHIGEIGLILAVVLIIFGLGRLPQISYKLAGGELPDRDGPPPDDAEPQIATDSEENAEEDAEEDASEGTVEADEQEAPPA